MSYHEEILASVASIIEGLTPLSNADEDAGFVELDRLTPEEAENDPKGHRAFDVKWSNGMIIAPFTGQFQKMVSTRGIDIMIIYRIEGRVPREVEAEIAEDGDQIAWALIDPLNKPTLTGAQFIQYMPDITQTTEQGETAAALRTIITVPVQYRSNKY